MKSSPLRRQAGRILVPTLLFFAIAVITANAWFAFRSVQELLDSEHWVEHTWQVINQVERIMSSAVDAETGNRGFLLTDDPSYLAPYTGAVHDLPAELDRFTSLTSDNPSQQTRVTELRAVLEQRLELLERGIELRRSGNANGVEALVVSGTGKTNMDHVRSIADQMEGEERRLLAVRTSHAQSSALRARFAVGLASALDLILIVLMFRYFAQERRQRMEVERTAETLAISRLEIERKAIEISALMPRSKNASARELPNSRSPTASSKHSATPSPTISGLRSALSTASHSRSKRTTPSVVDDVGRDYIKRVRGGVQRMGQLIDSLLQLSRITRAEIVREDFNLSDLAESVAANLQEENAAQRIAFHIQPGLEVNGDPKLLRVALENLIGNAVKFSSRKPESLVEFGWDPEQAGWFVRDNGAGFDMYYADKLFNAFNRLHGDKDFKGSGIGLATVARVIHRHHGRIWADSTVDHGATFWFTLG